MCRRRRKATIMEKVLEALGLDGGFKCGTRRRIMKASRKRESELDKRRAKKQKLKDGIKKRMDEINKLDKMRWKDGKLVKRKADQKKQPRRRKAA